MTKCLPILALTVFMGLAAQEQTKYAVINTKYILEKIPEYKEADKKLKELGDQWQVEIDEKQMALDKMYKNYEAEQFMLSEELKKKREDELFIKEKELRDLQKKRFGYEGDLFKERQKLVKPIQDKVYNAIQDFSNEKRYDIIFDKSSNLTMLFSNPDLDKSDDILKMLGYK